MAEKTDWVTIVGFLAGLAGLGIGAYLIFKKKEEEGVPSELKITSYQNLRTGITKTPGDTLDVVEGDTVRIAFQYSYKGPALQGKYHVAFWIKHTLDPHFEGFAGKDIDFNLDEAPKTVLVEETADIVIHSSYPGYFAAGRQYGLYVKIMSIPGPDIHHWTAANALRYLSKDYGAFLLQKPTAIPSQALPGENVQITCPITELQGIARTVYVRMTVYEGATLTFGVKQLDQQAKQVAFAAGEQKDVTFTHKATQTSNDDRDIKVEVIYQNEVIREQQWADIFKVVKAGIPEISNIAFDYIESPVLRYTTCGVTISWNYRGPAATLLLRVSIGHALVPWVSFNGTVTVPQTDVTTRKSSSILIPTKDLPESQSPYDIWGWVGGFASAIYNDAVIVREAAKPTFSNIVIQSYLTPVARGTYGQVIAQFNYVGPPTAVDVYAAIGNKGILGFDEKVHGVETFNIADSPELSLVTVRIFIFIDPQQISPGAWDVYAKIVDPQLISPILYDVITVT